MPKPVRLILVLIVVAVSAWFMSVYTRGSNPFYGDALGYYSYLPATFIYHNPRTFTEVPPDKGIPEWVYLNIRSMEYGYPRTPKGFVGNQYTYGIALMELPFFLVAHAYEKLAGGSANGYSDVYKNMLHVCAIVYTLLGLLITYRVARKFFDSSTALLSVLTLFIGTNLFWFALKQAGMSHVPIFFLVAALMWLTVRLYEKPAKKYFVVIGLVLGIITLIRPTDILFCLVPLLYNVFDAGTIRSKGAFIRTNFKSILLLIAAFLIPVIPQLLYWKWTAGSFIYYSYGEQGFNWDRPRILSGLLYFNNGWLAYTPVMVFALAGLLLYRSIRPWAWVVWIIIPAYVYIIYSWYCYNYINGLGSRPMIHLYPLLCIALAAFIRFAVNKGKIFTVLFSAVCVFFCAINISYSRQQALGILGSEESNFAYNSSILFRTTNTYRDLLTYDLAVKQPDEKKLVKTSISICNDYDDSLSAGYEQDTGRRSRYLYHMPVEQEFLHNPIKIAYDDKKFDGAKWLKCSGDFMVPEVPGLYNRHLFQMGVKRGDVFTKWEGVEIINKVDVWNSEEPEVLSITRFVINKWGHIWFYVQLPKDIQNGDVIELGLWNLGKQRIYLDNICLEVYK